MPENDDDLDEDDEDSATQVFVGAGRARKQSAAHVVEAAPARAPARDDATVRELPRPSAAAIPPPKPSLGQTVSLVRAPLDEQGFGARYCPARMCSARGAWGSSGSARTCASAARWP